MVPKKLTDSEFSLIYGKVPRACVDLVFETPEGILLTRRAINPYKGKWPLPGGGIRFGEKVEEAVKRIAKEELDLEIQSIKMLGFTETPKEKDPDRHSVSIVFLVKSSLEGMKLNSDSTSFKISKNLEEDLIPEQKDFLKNYIRDRD